MPTELPLCGLRNWYMVLDLKDAFFSLPLAKESQLFFAFEWQDQEIGFNGQLTWTHLPQGFKNSPTLFDEALHEDLALNPATLLPDLDLDMPLHDCVGILSQVHRLRKDLTDQPLPDGSSFVQNGQRYVGAAVVTETVWAAALPVGTSAQRAELIALTEALKLGRDRKLNMYMDSGYAFATAHVHGAIYQERGLLTAEVKTI
ncbi:uncharacterized protein LOC115069185 isoform X1 [Nannospalax galili]|uniref:uncharacterized protein LOC115069185 isoform X1 n=1 Tax=Nannospalax galili TaxID=1026970 RepID=UPI00111C5B28|nr:uncharacterized protein LOC115069185 isoform X1 [Nannospalax galili]